MTQIKPAQLPAHVAWRFGFRSAGHGLSMPTSVIAKVPLSHHDILGPCWELEIRLDPACAQALLSSGEAQLIDVLSICRDEVLSNDPAFVSLVLQAASLNGYRFTGRHFRMTALGTSLQLGPAVGFEPLSLDLGLPLLELVQLQLLDARQVYDEQVVAALLSREGLGAGVTNLARRMVREFKQNGQYLTVPAAGGQFEVGLPSVDLQFLGAPECRAAFRYSAETGPDLLCFVMH